MDRLFHQPRRIGNVKVNMKISLNAKLPMFSAKPQASADRRTMLVFAIVVAVPLLAAQAAWAWDSGTHRLITRLAVAALPGSPLKTDLGRNERALERYAVDPDTVLREQYGEEEARHHYINLEYFGADPFAALKPDLATMRREFGARTLRKSGTLPWRIEEVAQSLNQAWRSGDCAQALRLSGYLSHYIGDASQPLHTTRYYDGYAGDHGVHSRFEYATAHANRTIVPAAEREIRLETITAVWPPIIAEIRQSHSLIPQVIEADRAVRAETGTSRYVYDRALVNREGGLMARQVASAVSVLASVWLYEWNGAGHPSACAMAAGGGTSWRW
ncbi:MAG: zinc dependent phospholipase C family protein [Candidatus Binataceae bacterium]